MTLPASERELAALAAALAGPGARLTSTERALVPARLSLSENDLKPVRVAIARGDDPLGRVFCRLRSPELRRGQGAVYTPGPIIDAMVRWAAGEVAPVRVVDPGAGSGRFLVAAGTTFPTAELVAVEIDPLAALTLRANAATLGMTNRLTVRVADYRAVELSEIDGRTLFIGNPPYVRHHGISPTWKEWFADAAAAFGFKASKLAGLHVHFFLKTRMLAKPGDYGAFIMSAEWLDVNYGDVMRKLLVNGLGGTALHVLAPTSVPFADAATTGAITCFRVGNPGRRLRFRSVAKLSALGSLQEGLTVSRSRLETADRWSSFLGPPARAVDRGIALGELCRVHRGQVTGGNAVWIAGAYTGALPASVLVPTVTKARELFNAVPSLSSTSGLRRVIDLPADFDEFGEAERRQIRRFLAWAKRMGADTSYVARNRRAWWAVGLREPAPILATYMARRPPAFVRNMCGARHLNIAHGLYPREPLPGQVLDALSAWLCESVGLSAGRTYAGGLTKFEPKELERVVIPSLEELHERAQKLDTSGVDRRCREGQGTVSAATA